MRVPPRSSSSTPALRPRPSPSARSSRASSTGRAPPRRRPCRRRPTPTRSPTCRGGENEVARTAVFALMPKRPPARRAAGQESLIERRARPARRPRWPLRAPRLRVVRPPARVRGGVQQGGLAEKLRRHCADYERAPGRKASDAARGRQRARSCGCWASRSSRPGRLQARRRALARSHERPF